MSSHAASPAAALGAVDVQPRVDAAIAAILLGAIGATAVLAGTAGLVAPPAGVGPLAAAAARWVPPAACAALCLGTILWLVARLARPGLGGMLLAALLLGLSVLHAGGFLSGLPLLSCPAAVPVLAGLALTLDGQMLPGFALLGVACDLDLGSGIWGLAALSGVAVAAARDGRRPWRGASLGLACAALLAVPAALWCAHGMPGAPAVPAEPLSAEPGPAWLPTLAHCVLFVAALLLGLAACGVLRPDARRLSGALAGVLGVSLLGCALPLLTHQPLVWLLRPIAADGLLQVLASVAAIAVVLRDLAQMRDGVRVLLALGVLAGLVLAPFLLPLAALAMLARAALANGEMLRLERIIPPARGTALRYTALALAVVVLGCGIGLRAHVWSGETRAGLHASAE
jgi:hypothetical protein